MKLRFRRAFLVGLAFAMLSTNSVFAASAVPFSYTVDFKVNLQGRDMTSSTGKFCNWFHATWVEQPRFEQGVRISLWDGGGQVGITVNYPTDGAQYVACWTGFLPGHVYYFRYIKNNNTFRIQGAGNVSK